MAGLVLIICYAHLLQVTKVTGVGDTDVDMEVVTTETVWREVRRVYVIHYTIAILLTR